MMSNCLWDKNVKCDSETQEIRFSSTLENSVILTHPCMCVRVYFHDVEMLTFYV